MSLTKEQLATEVRWAMLATVDPAGLPAASSVALALHRPSAGYLLHLSDLAAHTGNLRSTPAASILLAQPDSGQSDPQELARLTLTGPVLQIDREEERFEMLAKAYIDCFPDAAMRFGFADFRLFLFQPNRGNYVGGFARAQVLEESTVQALLGES